MARVLYYLKNHLNIYTSSKTLLFNSAFRPAYLYNFGKNTLYFVFYMPYYLKKNPLLRFVQQPLLLGKDIFSQKICSLLISFLHLHLSSTEKLNCSRTNEEKEDIYFLQRNGDKPFR